MPFIPAETALYHVTVTDSSGCKVKDSVFVTVNLVPDVFISPKNHAPYCPGTQFYLNAYNATTYKWSPVTGLNTTVGSSVTINAKQRYNVYSCGDW